MINDQTSIMSKLSGQLSHASLIIAIIIIGALFTMNIAYAQSGGRAKEGDYYKIVTIPSPADVPLEVSGFNLQPNGDLVVSIRYGQVWLIKNPYMTGSAQPYFKKIASGLHTPMGIAEKDGKYYVAQRSELTELSDTNGDGSIDRFHTICTFDMSGNYCEYAYGPIILPDGSFWVDKNLATNGWFTRDPLEGDMGSHARWDGWAIKISPDGKLKPIATGMRSGPGMGIGKDGTLYFAENQGSWVGTDYVTTVKKGDFLGNPAGLKSASLPKSNIDLKPKDIPLRDSLMLHEAAKLIPELKMPTVRLPYGVMGTSASGILEDTTGAFGPYEGQLFVGDETQARVMRIFTEQVKGKMQGAAFPFRKGFASGVISMTWGKDGSMFVGMSDRGWKSIGPKSSGLQRLVWTGRVPFEVKAIRAKSDGFQLEFTKPVDPQTAGSLKSYHLSSFDYLYHKEYGSPRIDQKDSHVQRVILSKDSLRVRLVVREPLRTGYIYRMAVKGVRSTKNDPVLHPEAFYTLNQIPPGEKAPSPPSEGQRDITSEPSESPTKSDNEDSTTGKKHQSAPLSISDNILSEGKMLVVQNHCPVCHSLNTKSTGPSFMKVAQKYHKNKKTINQLSEKIIQGGSGNWGQLSMPPHPNISKENAKKIVKYILSLNEEK